MLSVLKNRVYRHLLLAQLSALLGSGLATVALALLAYEIAGAGAGTVLGTALAVKMIAYVAVAPIAAAFAGRMQRRTLLVALDLVRAAVVLAMPFVTQAWQIYALIFVLQSASAAFTPAFQATIPEILPDEAEYTKALSLSRLAHDVESLVSPLMAAVLLTVIGFHFLFVGTAIGFLVSAGLVISVVVPNPGASGDRGIYERLTLGTRIFFATPRLRALMGINLAVASAGAMVIVNTVVFVQQQLGLHAGSTALAFAAFGAGSMLIALVMPSLLERAGDRVIMLAGSAALAIGTAAIAAVDGYLFLIAVWFFAGAAYSAAQLPAGRLLRRSAHLGDLPALFAAQFALSHACWLFAYPFAGWIGAAAGLPVTAIMLALVAAFASLWAWRHWPANDPEPLEHEHPELPPDHPHLRQGSDAGAQRHRHPIIIDDLHHGWPSVRH